MGNDELRFGATSIQEAGGGIRTSAADMRSRLAAFKGELDGHGQPWGTDDLGSLIGMCYQAIYEAAMESFDGNIGAIDEDGAGVQIMGANYGAGEQGSEIKVNRVREILG